MLSKLTLPIVILFLFITPEFASGDNQTGAKTDINRYLNELPDDLILIEESPQSYIMTTIWHNRDIGGNATAKYIIRGKYTRGLPDRMVRWNDVMIEIFSDPGRPESDTSRQGWMEDFSYKSPDDLVSLEMFMEFPSDESRHLLYTLVWDAILFEVYAWDYFDKLELNQTINPARMENLDIDMAGWGTIKMQNLEMKWSGISSMNGELCAIIEYESLVNPVSSFGSKGRSCYWGEIWVSLHDKQIESGRLNEDVTMQMTGQDGKFINIQREVSFEKITE